MAGTYSQIYIQVVFAVQGRQNLLHKEWREECLKYMSGIITNKGHKPIIVNGVDDHVHVFLGLKPAMALSDLVRDVKNNSSNFINDQPVDQGKILLAGGIRSIFLQPFASWECIQLHPEPGRAP